MILVVIEAPAVRGLSSCYRVVIKAFSVDHCDRDHVGVTSFKGVI